MLMRAEAAALVTEIPDRHLPRRDRESGWLSTVMSNMYALHLMPLAHGFMSAAPAASSVMKA